MLSSNSIQKRLGYSRNTKLLIIHADDLGMCRSENAATIEALENGTVNSASVMVPCPGFDEIAEYLKNHKKTDAGLHLTLTSEWPSYKWKPLLPASEVSSIVDSTGHFFLSKAEFSKNADANEVEKECRAQINKALDSGIRLSHIDSHMFTGFSNINILKKYLLLGQEYNLPVLLTHELPSWTRKSRDAVVVDSLYCAAKEDFDKGLNKYYRNVLKSIKPGLNCLLVHTAFNNSEMQEISHNQIAFGSEWRQEDYDFFTSGLSRKLIIDNNIQLITWGEIHDKLFHRN